MLKERGSDLGDTLETAATEFLSDVKKKDRNQDGAGACGAKEEGGGASASTGSIAAILTAGLPEYNASNDDAGSSFEEASVAENIDEDDEDFDWDDEERPRQAVAVAANLTEKVPAAVEAAPVSPPPPSASRGTDLNDINDDDDDDDDNCRGSGSRRRTTPDHVGKEGAMEQLDVVREEAEEEERQGIPQNPVPQIPALVRIPLCPPPIPLLPPPPVPTDGGGGGNDDLGGDMWARARRRSSAAAAASASASALAARKDSCVSSSEEGGGVAELVRKSSTVLGQLMRVDDIDDVEGAANLTHDEDDGEGDHDLTDGARAGAEEGRRPREVEGELLLSQASTRLSALSVRGTRSDVRGVMASPSFSSSLDGDDTAAEQEPGRGRGHRQRGGTELRREEGGRGEIMPATTATATAVAPQKRAKLRSSTTKSRKKSTLASKWRRQRERQRSREPSPPSPESPPPSPFHNVTQGLSTIG